MHRETRLIAVCADGGGGNELTRRILPSAARSVANRWSARVSEEQLCVEVRPPRGSRRLNQVARSQPEPEEHYLCGPTGVRDAMNKFPTASTPQGVNAEFGAVMPSLLASKILV